MKFIKDRPTSFFRYQLVWWHRSYDWPWEEDSERACLCKFVPLGIQFNFIHIFVYRSSSISFVSSTRKNVSPQPYKVFFLLSLRWWTWLRPSSVLRVTPTPMERRLHWSGGCWAAEVSETSCVWALKAHVKINKLWFMSVLFVVVVCLQPRPLSPSWPGGVHLRCDIPAF